MCLEMNTATSLEVPVRNTGEYICSSLQCFMVLKAISLSYWSQEFSVPKLCYF